MKKVILLTFAMIALSCQKQSDFSMKGLSAFLFFLLFTTILVHGQENVIELTYHKTTEYGSYYNSTLKTYLSIIFPQGGNVKEYEIPDGEKGQAVNQAIANYLKENFGDKNIEKAIIKVKSSTTGATSYDTQAFADKLDLPFLQIMSGFYSRVAKSSLSQLRTIEIQWTCCEAILPTNPNMKKVKKKDRATVLDQLKQAVEKANNDFVNKVSEDLKALGTDLEITSNRVNN